MKVEANLQALSVLVVKGKGPGSEDESLAVQHAVLPHHDLHEGLAATEVQERTPANTYSTRAFHHSIRMRTWRCSMLCCITVICVKALLPLKYRKDPLQVYATIYQCLVASSVLLTNIRNTNVETYSKHWFGDGLKGRLGL